MYYLPIQYEQPLFRPPSEAYSLILQITYGCTWNKCAFCEMYNSKKFRIKKEEKVLDEIQKIASSYSGIRKIFLADGNAMALSTKRLLTILNSIQHHFPEARRVSSYALPANIISKSMEELIALRQAGLQLLYVGIESGDDELLRRINKGETYDSTVFGLLKAKEAGMKLSVIILNGMGGMKYSKQHAIHSAEILNAIQPEFVSTLVLSFPYGIERYKQRFDGEYIPMQIPDLLKEMETFIAHTELNNTVFRSDHASNYLVLKGNLSRDKKLFLNNLHLAIHHPDKTRLREEWQRGL